LIKQKKEKNRLLLEIEQEEEFLTNTLQKKLAKLLEEKVDLEKQLEEEEEYLVNKLQLRLDQVTKEKSELNSQFEKKNLEFNKLSQEQGNMRKKIEEQEKMQKNYVENNEIVKNQLLKLKKENFNLTQHVRKEKEKLANLKNDIAVIETENELDLERQFNKMRLFNSNTFSGGVSPQSGDLPSPQKSPRNLALNFFFAKKRNCSIIFS